MTTNLAMLFVRHPFTLIHSSTCVVEGALTVTKALLKSPCVLISQRVLSARNSPQIPRVCTFSMLHNSEKVQGQLVGPISMVLFWVIFVVFFALGVITRTCIRLCLHKYIETSHHMYTLRFKTGLNDVYSLNSYWVRPECHFPMIHCIVGPAAATSSSPLRVWRCSSTDPRICFQMDNYRGSWGNTKLTNIRPL